MWPLFVANEIAVWVRFYEFWMSVSEHLIVLPIRYEDLLAHKQVLHSSFLSLFIAFLELSYSALLTVVSLTSWRI
jgi:hypothetical protein